MKQIPIPALGEWKERLRRRLGLPRKRWFVRIKPGGWVTLPPGMVKSLNLRDGDVVRWQLIPGGIEGLRICAEPRRYRRTRSDGFDLPVRSSRRTSGRRDK